jgi:AbrB family looped-hinge helix DNA binding protein
LSRPGDRSSAADPNFDLAADDAADTFRIHTLGRIPASNPNSLSLAGFRFWSHHVSLTGKTGASTMAAYATTRLSSKGQIVIPEDVRKDLGLAEGDQFVVIGQGDAVILKVITPPKLEDFQKLLSQAGVMAKKARIRRADLKSAIVKVRRRAK